MERESEKPEQAGTLCRFADNTKLGGAVGVPSTRASIQQDLGKLEANNLTKLSRDMWSTALSWNNPKHQFRLGINWLKSSPTEKDPRVILKASLNGRHKWGKPLLVTQEIRGSCRPFCLVLVRLHLFEPPVQEGGGDAGQDPAGELLKQSGPRALLLWGELEGIKLAESVDDEVKTGCNSSPQATQRQLKRWWSQTLLSSSSDWGSGHTLWLGG